MYSKVCAIDVVGICCTENYRTILLVRKNYVHLNQTNEHQFIMKAQTSLGKARFDARLSIEEKELFERAASIAGFRTLTDFVLRTVKVKAKQIVDEHELILASKRDGEIFFNAILNSDTPNTKLQNAAKKYLKERV